MAGASGIPRCDRCTLCAGREFRCYLRKKSLPRIAGNLSQCAGIASRIDAV